MKPSHEPYPWGIASQYFLYFGVMGIFLPYFNLYCFQIGLNGFQIGVLSAARSVVTLIFPILFGLIADRFQARKPIFIACSFVSALIWMFFLWVVDFWLLLMLSIFYSIFYTPMISFLESLTMDTLGKGKKAYGRVRVWGSISFILTVMMMGKIIDRLSIQVIPVAILIGSVLQALNSLQIPYRPKPDRSYPAPGQRFFAKKRIIFFLFSAFLMLVSHGTYYGFFSIHLKNLGYSSAYIGTAWALASLAEIVAMVKSNDLFKEVAIEKVLILSFVAAVVRWTALYWAVSPVFILITQMLHAASYGTFHMAGILYIDRMTTDQEKTMGQAINNAATYGMGLMAGFFLNGYLYERMGSKPLFLISAGIAAAGGLLMAANLFFGQRRGGEKDV